MTTDPGAVDRKSSTRTVYAIKEGWISKKGSKAFHSFRDRYMILWSNKRIEYYTNETLEQLKGTIDLKALHRRFIQRSDKVRKTKNKNKSKKQQMYGFKVSTNKRIYYVCVSDAHERDEWIQNIRNVIDDILPAQPIIKPIQKKQTNSNLLKSKISKIKLQNTAKWNELMRSTHAKAKEQKCEDSVQSHSHSLLSQMDRDRNTDTNERFISNIICDKISNDIDSEETELSPMNGETMNEFECEGSPLGLSLSTSPILYTPNSPNNIMREISNDELTDFWDLDLKSEFVELSDINLNAIHCRKQRSAHWISCFGTKIVCGNGQRHAWQIKILPRDNNRHNTEVANVVIGICDTEIVQKQKERSTYAGIGGGFWSQPYFGYGYTGVSGHKMCDGINKAQSQMYGRKYKINDVITVELNEKNELRFMQNKNGNGIAFKVDNHRNYVLAVAFCNDRYDLQIYD